MWVNGMIAVNHRGQTAVQDVVDGNQDNIDEFGIDYDPPSAEEQVNTVHVPETLCDLTDDQRQQFLDASIASRTLEISEGVGHHIECRDYLKWLLRQSVSDQDSDLKFYTHSH